MDPRKKVNQEKQRVSLLSPTKALLPQRVGEYPALCSQQRALAEWSGFFVCVWRNFS